MSPADVLEAAADALFVHGRSIGYAVEPTGAMCVEGAICFVQGIDPAAWHRHSTEAVRALQSYLDREYVYDWNDETEDDSLVIDTLRRCAKALREVEAP